MTQPFSASPFRDVAEDELERIGMMLEGYLQNMERFSVDTGHLLQHRTPATRMFKGMNMLLLMAVQYEALMKESQEREDAEGEALYKWFVEDFFMPVIEISYKNFHAYQKTPRVYLTPRLAPKGGTQESITRMPLTERLRKRLGRTGDKPLDTPAAPPSVTPPENKKTPAKKPS